MFAPRQGRSAITMIMMIMILIIICFFVVGSIGASLAVLIVPPFPFCTPFVARLVSLTPMSVYDRASPPQGREASFPHSSQWSTCERWLVFDHAVVAYLLGMLSVAFGPLRSLTSSYRRSAAS